jgi:hypothetical protein
MIPNGSKQDTHKEFGVLSKKETPTTTCCTLGSMSQVAPHLLEMNNTAENSSDSQTNDMIV